MPGNPHAFGVIVYDTDGSTPKGSVTVLIRNESNNNSLSGTTDTDGSVIFGLSNFTNGWNPGDIISYYTSYAGYQAEGSITVQDTGGTQVTLTLVALPTAPSLKYFTVQEFLDTFNLVTYDVDNASGVKPSIIVKVGESIEREIDQITNRTWDDNDGDYYTVTNEYHNVEGLSSSWPYPSDTISPRNVFFTDKLPIKSLTTFQVNLASPDSTEDWATLTEDDNEITVKNAIGRIEIVDGSKYPIPGSDQVRITYTHGEDSVPADIKRLAILMTAKAFAGQALQRLNIDVTEASGLSNAIQNIMNYDSEVKSILDNRIMPEVRSI